MEKVIVTSKNGYFKYSANLVVRIFSKEKPIEFYGLENTIDKGDYFECLLSKTPFKEKTVVYGDESASFSRFDYFEDLWGSFYTIQIGSETFYIKTVGSSWKLTNDNLDDEGEDSDSSFSLGRFEKERKKLSENDQYVLIGFDNLRIPFFMELNNKKVEYYMKTWRVLERTSFEKIDIENFVATKPILIQIPMEKFGLKVIDENSRDNPFVALMVRHGFSLEKEKKYIEEVNRCLKKTVGKFCYLFLVPVEQDIKRGFNGLLFEDEGIE